MKLLGVLTLAIAIAAVGTVQSDEVWEFIMERQGFRWVVLETQYKGL